MSLTAGLFNSGIFEGGLFNGGLFSNTSSQPTTWDLTVVTTGASQDYTVDLYSGIGVDIYIDWGDSSANSYTSTGQKTHTYASAGTYTIKISGAFTSGGNIRLGSNAGNRSRLKSVYPVPNLNGFTILSSSLKDCTGITSIPTDLLKYVTQVTNLSYFMYGCSGLTGPIPNDLLRYVTQVTNLSYFMYGCTGLDNAVPADLLRYVVNCLLFSNFALGITWTTASYSALIISMNTYLTKTGVPFHGGSSKYNTSAAADHTNLTSVKSWTITDGGPA